jgi:cysteinyl-tRNA synthetase
MKLKNLICIILLVLPGIAWGTLPQIESWVWFDYRASTKPLVEDKEPKLVVLDPDCFLEGEIETLKQAGHTVLAYVCIGEAESWRSYWGKINYESWVLGPSARRNGSYFIRFYTAYTWSDVLKNYISNLQNMGFQGVLLDPGLALDYYPDKTEDMADLVTGLAKEVKSNDPHAYVVLLNAGQLLQYTDMSMQLDGFAEEGVWWDKNWLRTDDQTSLERVNYLVQARGLGITPLVMEFADNDAAIIETETLASGEGFIPFFPPKDWLKYW